MKSCASASARMAAVQSLSKQLWRRGVSATRWLWNGWVDFKARVYAEQGSRTLEVGRRAAPRLQVVLQRQGLRTAVDVEAYSRRHKVRRVDLCRSNDRGMKCWREQRTSLA